MAFSKLNDAGLYGVCECDLESTMTQLLITSFSGKPGFVSDPVFDTSRHEVIHAHCVLMQVLAPDGDLVTRLGRLAGFQVIHEV